MAPRSRFRPYALAPLLAACLAGAPDTNDPGISLTPYHGVAADLLAGLVSLDPHVRTDAEAAVVERGEDMLPYVLHAAESRWDPCQRARFRDVVRRIRAGAGPLPPFQSAGGQRTTPFKVEYPPFDQMAVRLVGEFHRRAGIAGFLAQDAGCDVVFDTLVAFARAHPERVEDVLGAARYRIQYGPGTRYQCPQVHALIETARRIARAAPPERASRLAVMVSYLGTEDAEDSLAAVVKRYPGTHGALLAEERLIEVSRGRTNKQVEAMEAFVSRHPGTQAAAKGLEWLAFEYSCLNISRKEMSGIQRLRAFDSVAARLFEQQAGKGVPRLLAAELPSFSFQQEFDPTALYTGLLAATREFVACHFLPDPLGPDPGVTGASAVEWSLRRLHRALWDPADDDSLVDREYVRLQERRPGDASVAWCRAVFHAKTGQIDRALVELKRIEDALPDALYGRKALATRATVLYAAGRFPEAATAYARYAERYPDSSYAWLAALRAGHALLHAGDAEGALRAYTRAEDGRRSSDVLAFLLPMAKARALEGVGRYSEAGASLRRALTVWPSEPLRMFGTRLEELGCIHEATDVYSDLDTGVCRADIEARVRLLGAPGVSHRDLTRFREAERRAGAGDSVGAAEIFASLVIGSKPPAVRTQAEDRVADLAIPKALTAKNPRDRDRLLALAGKRGGRLGALAADVARACFGFSAGGSEDAAAAIFRQALDRWWRTQPSLEPSSALERDVALVRRTISPPKDPGPGDLYRVVRPRVFVTEADGTRRRPAAVPDFGGESRVIRFDDRERGLVLSVLARLGSERRRSTVSVMAIPQPAGRAKELQELVARFLPVYPGHWGGWSMNSLPNVFNIEFEDEARSHARVTTAGGRYSGNTYTVERRGRKYVVTGTVSSWIE